MNEVNPRVNVVNVGNESSGCPLCAHPGQTANTCLFLAYLFWPLLRQAASFPLSMVRLTRATADGGCRRRITGKAGAFSTEMVAGKDPATGTAAPLNMREAETSQPLWEQRLPL